MTTVYVAHDQAEAMTLGHRVCVLRDDRLQQAGTPQYLYQSPVNLFVAGFIGSPEMNFVTAELVRDGGPAVTFAGYRLPVHQEQPPTHNHRTTLRHTEAKRNLNRSQHMRHLQHRCSGV